MAYKMNEKNRAVKLGVLLSCVLVIVIILVVRFVIITHKEWVQDDIYASSNVEEYDKELILTSCGSDLNSALLIFPEKIDSDADVCDYLAEFKSGLFDTDGTLILKCKYNDTSYQKELDRISNIEMTICDVNSEQKHTNKIMYDEESFELPAYIASYGFGNTYEYALVNDDAKEIAYIYLAYPNPEDFEYPEYLMKNLEAYNEENTSDAYTIYDHSFDGGKSYIEFDDSNN
ncbi:hypothetical protein SAMN02910298_02916 [Pseudobutyrivibrio sp. YE44]|nr:hypothetical protein SAMN02910298_02916 [Pseudobutyrivibrio sp. YE44]